MDDAIVKPVRGKRSPRLGPVAIIAATPPDLKLICELTGLDSGRHHSLYISELIVSHDPSSHVAVAGPVVGAPYAAMILETLLSWGACEIIFCGWCGAISPSAAIGDILVPDAAIIDEGTSQHYRRHNSHPTPLRGSQNDSSQPGFFSAPSAHLVRQLAETVLDKGCKVFREPIWSTDAIYRETTEKVRHFRKMGCLAVEMELSALFTVAAFREAALAGVLVVSDDLSTLSWKPGFRQPAFKQGRQTACEVAASLATRRASVLQGK